MSVIQPTPGGAAATAYAPSRNASPSAPVVDAGSGTSAAAPWAASPWQQQSADAKNALQKSLNQGLQAFMQKLRVDLSRPPKQSSQVDSMQKALLKQRVEALRQMMQTTGRDKASLRALASELARVAKELKALVASMSENAADAQLSVNIDGAAAGGNATAGEGAATDSASDSGGHADAQTDGGGDAAPADVPVEASSGSVAQEGQAASPEQAAASGAASTPADASGAKDEAAAPADAHSALSAAAAKSGGNPVASDKDVQEMLMVLKMIREWIKQQAQQLQNQDDLKDSLKSADKSLDDIDKILGGGPQAEAALGEQVSVNVDISGLNVSA